MDYSYWSYFLSLENDLNRCSKYVEFAENNLSVYSTEILKLFFAASSEFEVVMKEIGRKYKYSKILEARNDKNINIETIKNLINENTNLRMMKEMPICLKHYNLTFVPIKEIFASESWWRDYNLVKHNRSKNYFRANLKNALKSTGSLFLANVFFYEIENHKEKCTFNDNLTITLSNLPKTNLFETKNKSYYSLSNASFFT